MLTQNINCCTRAVCRGLGPIGLLCVGRSGARGSNGEWQTLPSQRRLQRFSEPPHAIVTFLSEGISTTFICFSRSVGPFSMNHIKCSVRYAHKFVPPVSDNILKLRSAIEKNLHPICFFVKNDYTMGHHVYDQHFRVSLYLGGVLRVGPQHLIELLLPVPVAVGILKCLLALGVCARPCSVFRAVSRWMSAGRESFAHHYSKARRTMK